MPIPAIRIRHANDCPVRPDREFVLYWMHSARRLTDNYALDHAIERAGRLKRPLVILEALRLDYPWASRRMHGFVLHGMRDNEAAASRKRVTYYPYLERARGEGRGLLRALAARSCLVVADEYPCFFLPAMVRAAARRLDVRVDMVDGNGLLPLRAAERAFPTAHGFRRFVHRVLPDHLVHPPRPEPLRGAQLAPPVAIPPDVAERWPPLRRAALRDIAALLDGLPIDHSIGTGWTSGGPRAGEALLARFVETSLDAYARHRNDPDRDGTSGLSSYLHFGHVSPHAVLAGALAGTNWTPDRIEQAARGGRAGWGMDEHRTGFLDQVITWRELAFNMSAHRPRDYDALASLPDWARATLDDHAHDRREYVYTLDQFAAAETHDPLWNAAQRQLVREGRLHNYLRMLWGKKILEWSPAPEAALQVMIELNNRYALDGRDPNSYAGIFWVLGRYDRAWGPERAVYGKVRYMSSANTRRKLAVTRYLEAYGP